MRERGRRPTAVGGTPAAHPAQLVVIAFAVAVVAGTALLLLPAARRGSGGATLLEALFTATSAVCVTGLIVVDTASYWSGFGQAVILGLMQVGGFGIMTTASLLVLLTSRRLGLRSRLTAAAETRSLGPGDVRRVLVGVAAVSLTVEAAVAALLATRFATAYGATPVEAAYLGVFHAVSAFNNAGFALYPDSLERFVIDPWICLPIAVAVVLGGLGFPVLLELRRGLRRPRRWSLHTRLTVGTTAVLLVGGAALFTATEWTNPATLGPLNVAGKLMAGAFQAVMPRTAGFHSIDPAVLDASTRLELSVLMFIGGGSAGTAGGIKVTTFALLAFVILAEVRGERRVVVGDREIGEATQRVALTVALLAVAAVVLPTLVLLRTTGLGIDELLFEVVSAFSTVGLSTGITDDLPVAGQVLLMVLMFAGRLGPVTVATALALRRRERLYQLPEGRPLIG